MNQNRNVLLTPGPTPVPPEALKILSQPIFHHRTPQYRKVFGRVSLGLQEVFQTKSNVFTLTSSGTGAMEAAVVNFLSPGDTILVAHAGKFGERWLELGKSYGMNVLSVSAPYGEAIDPAEIRKVLQVNPFTKAVYTTHCETSTGVTYDIQSIAEMVSKSNAILVVDAISGLGADPLPQDEWKVDVVVSGSQKALMLPPGLAFISASERALALNKTSTCQKYYCDLKLYQKAFLDSDTPFTPALTLVLALEETLKLIQVKGLRSHLNETARLADATRAALRAIKLELFAKSHPSNAVTAVKVPNGIDGEKLIKIMRDEKGVTMAGGQGSMKGKIFRIAHMGYITKEDLTIGLQILCETLSALGFQASSEEAVHYFNETYKRPTAKEVYR
ncbi:MAG: alanine--glyoxylate aminotransferase family protein [Candidatus Omnitrophica bacterium]|nr:alanine--glyoxylate aminotransferase family protein [Candidatus Omnitrophota bacterium]